MNSVKQISRCAVKNFGKRSVLVHMKILQCWKIRYFYSTSELYKKYDINEDDVLLNKIIYNEVLEKQNKTKITPSFDEPICLKYLREENHELKENTTKNVETEETKIIHFPFERVQKFSHTLKEYTAEEPPPSSATVKSVFDVIHDFTPTEEQIKIAELSPVQYKIRLRDLEKTKKWMSQYKKNIELEQTLKFGSCNPNKPVSFVPCGGCGALLHCNDPTIPGFIPAEIFESKKKKELSEETCQRCKFLKKFDIALGVNVSPSEYPALISQIKEKKSFVIIMIDMLDFPCSIFPGILDLIGSTKSVIILGNKVDLLIQEGNDVLQQFKEALVHCLRKEKFNLENVIHIGLISAKTGYGIENLITVLQKHCQKKDVYLIGCTNVGKSSLFNSLIQSDYCKVKAADLMQRATVSTWPGTTLNLLKFPITKTEEWRLIARSKRLAALVKEEEAFSKFQSIQQTLRLEQIPIQGYVGRTFRSNSNTDLNEQQNSSDNLKKPKGINYLDSDFAKNNWFYDTPGVVHKDQIINLLTTSELLLTVPKKMLLPRNFHLKPGYSLFIGGLARLDYIDGADFVWFTVFASMELPITVTKLEDAEYVYQQLLGSPFFRVPMEGKERLAKWPSFSSKKFEIHGKFTEILQNPKSINVNPMSKAADVDIVLSSAGWISVNVPLGYRCKVEAWTPEGRGIYARSFPIIKMGHTFKGQKINGTPAFRCIMKEVKGYSLEDPTPF